MKFFSLIFLLFSFSAQADLLFAKKKIQVGTQQIVVEIADTVEKREQGLMFRKHLDPNSGMLFIFNNAEVRNFWMKNTFIPLDIGYFDEKKMLIDIQSMRPVVSEMHKDIPVYASRGKAQYALELNPEWFARNHVKKGARLKILD